ncbi:MAG: hypothetical protein ACI865_001298 [Flavobacteriaceae bacterium]|jgi:hypothetical protein
MGKYKPHIVFVALMSCYFLVRYIRSTFHTVPDFIHFYLTDLLFVPVMATVALIIVRLIKRNQRIMINPRLVFLQTALISIYFEWYLPRYDSSSNVYTADLWDVVMYFSGAILFLLLQKKLFLASN